MVLFSQKFLKKDKDGKVTQLKMIPKTVDVLSHMIHPDVQMKAGVFSKAGHDLTCGI